jgi:hypothetical protein
MGVGIARPLSLDKKSSCMTVGGETVPAGFAAEDETRDLGYEVAGKAEVGSDQGAAGDLGWAKWTRARPRWLCPPCSVLVLVRRVADDGHVERGRNCLWIAGDRVSLAPTRLRTPHSTLHTPLRIVSGLF